MEMWNAIWKKILAWNGIGYGIKEFKYGMEENYQ